MQGGIVDTLLLATEISWHEETCKSPVVERLLQLENVVMPGWQHSSAIDQLLPYLLSSGTLDEVCQPHCVSGTVSCYSATHVWTAAPRDAALQSTVCMPDAGHVAESHSSALLWNNPVTHVSASSLLQPQPSGYSSCSLHRNAGPAGIVRFMGRCCRSGMRCAMPAPPRGWAGCPGSFARS